MTNRIPKADWKRFFDDLSFRKNGWETTVEILSRENGAEIVADRMPLIEIKVDDFFGDLSFEIMFGDPVVYKTHTIAHPKSVYFHRQEMNSSNLIEIEDETGTKTLVQIIQKIIMPVVYTDYPFDLRTF